VGSAAHLAAAWQKVRRKPGAAGPDRQSVTPEERRVEAELAARQKKIREGKWNPPPARRALIPQSRPA